MSDRTTHAHLAGIAAAIGQPARAAILTALLSGEWLPAGELARRAAISQATASGHLAQLTSLGLVVRRAQGRHRYHALAGPDVAAALEALARVTVPRGDHRSAVPAALRYARTCYDHLAGRLGVWLREQLLASRVLTPDGLVVSSAGRTWLGSFGVDVAGLEQGRRPLVRLCLDWSERKDHLAGALGAALAGSLLERGWLTRAPDTRAVRLTLRGRVALGRALGAEPPAPQV